MHISHNTFLKWKQIPLQSFSLFLSLSLPHSFSWKHSSVSPHVLHPSLLRRHFNLAHQLGSFLPLTRVSFAFCHRWMITTTQDSCFVGCVITVISSIWHRPHRALDGNLLLPYKIPQYGHLYFLKRFLLMQVAITASKSGWGTRLAHVGMLSDQSAHWLAITYLHNNPANITWRTSSRNTPSLKLFYAIYETSNGRV